MHAERTALDLAAVTEVIRYVRSLGPLADPPELTRDDGFYVNYGVHLHRIPKDLFDAMLAVHDDLPWGPVEHYPDPERGTQHWSVTLNTDYAATYFYTEHEPLGEPDA